MSVVVPYRLRWAALAVLLVAEAMVLLDTTIVSVAAPVVHANLPGPPSDVQWFSAAFTLPFAALLVTGGRLGDVLGRRRMFRIGIAGFVLASTACALAGSAPVLVGARALQGAAAALVVPQTIGMIRALFAGPELPRALGTIGPVMGLTAICGPALGGLLTHVDLLGLSWRAVFLVNVPLGIGVLAAAPLMREDRSPTARMPDPVGTVLLVAAAVGLTVPLVGSPFPVPTFVAGLALFAAFVWRQPRVAPGTSPLVEPSLFRGPGFGAALACSALFFAVLNGLMLVVALAVQRGHGPDALDAGLTLVPLSAASAVGSWVSGRHLVGRFGAAVMPAGLGLVLAGLAGAALVWPRDPAGYPGALAAVLGVAGLGAGLFTTAFFTTALHRVRPHETGSAAGLLNAVQQFGSTLGVAVLGSVYLAAVDGGTADGGVHATLTAIGMIVAAGLAARVLGRAAVPPEPGTSGAPETSPGASG